MGVNERITEAQKFALVALHEGVDPKMYSLTQESLRRRGFLDDDGHLTPGGEVAARAFAKGHTPRPPRRRAVWSAAGWTPSAEQDAILADLEDQAGPRAEWANARTDDAAEVRAMIRREIARLHDVARRAGIPVDHIAGAVGVSPQQLHNIVKQARGA